MRFTFAQGDLLNTDGFLEECERDMTLPCLDDLQANVLKSA